MNKIRPQTPKPQPKVRVQLYVNAELAANKSNKELSDLLNSGSSEQLPKYYQSSSEVVQDNKKELEAKDSEIAKLRLQLSEARSADQMGNLKEAYGALPVFCADWTETEQSLATKIVNARRKTPNPIQFDLRVNNIR